LRASGQGTNGAKPALKPGQQGGRQGQPLTTRCASRGDPMTTHTTATTAYDEPCPGCGQVDGTSWVTSTPVTDAWACRHCGTEWTITVHTPGVAS
ncbi:MAG: hypothetical protein ACREQ5_15400, partial [Candidatus Dormibacteria bacterium]